MAFWPTVHKTGAAATGRIVATQFCPFQIVTVTVFLPWSRFSSATTTWCLRVGQIMEFLVANLSQLSLSTQYLFASKICWQVKRIKRPYMDGCTIYLIPKTLYPLLQRQSLDMHMCSVNNLHWIDNANGWEHKRDLAFKHFPPLVQIFVIKKYFCLKL